MDYRHHFTTLSATQKAIYETFSKKFTSCSSVIKLPLVHLNEIGIAFEALTLDNPWMIQSDLSYQYTKDLNKKVLTIQPEYDFTKKDIARHQAIISASLDFVDAVKQKNDFEKVKFVHDYILNTVQYSFSQEAYSALGIALNKAGVCVGIAKYVKLALDRLLLKSIVVTGRAINPSFEQDEREEHAWNMVEIDGEWFYLDVTFDLTLKHNINRYDYFLVGNKDINVSHTTANRLPLASAAASDYYTKNGLIASDLATLGKLIYATVSKGRTLMQFRLLNANSIQDPCSKILQVVGNQCQRIYKREFSMEIRYNSALWIFEIEIK